jgi:hypothetical protein
MWKEEFGEPADRTYTAIIELYKTAFRTKHPDRVRELYGQVLVFTVSHDIEVAHLYGPFSVASDSSARMLEFYRYDIDMCNFAGVKRFKPYNFVCNVYDKFAPEHLKKTKPQWLLCRSQASFTTLDSGRFSMERRGLSNARPAGQHLAKEGHGQEQGTV